MKKQTVIFLAGLFQCVAMYAQWHDNHWILGGINQPPFQHMDANLFTFDSNELKVGISNHKLNLSVAKLIMSDENGDFIFYSNGLKINDNNDELMLNGDTLNAGPLVNSIIGCQTCGYYLGKSMLCLPFSNVGLYQIVHLVREAGQTPNIPTLLITAIDMSQNNGDGVIASKNVEVISSNAIESPVSSRHANGEDWWIIVPEVYDSLYWQLLLTKNGVIQVTPQKIGGYPLPTTNTTNGGQNTFSPDGTKFIDYGSELGLRVFDFDRCTGFLSNPIHLAFPHPIENKPSVGVAVSPNSRFLYACNAHTIVQFDLWSNNLTASVDTVAFWDGNMDPTEATSYFFDMLLGPDGKIYIGTPSLYSKAIHVINYPNKKGDACDVRQRYIQLPNNEDGDFPLFPNYRLGPLDGSPCDTLGLDNVPLAGFRCEALPGSPLEYEFTDNSFYEPAQWHWDFGDGTTSTDTNAVHAFPAPGTYTVCLTVSNANGSDTWCKAVSAVVAATGGTAAVGPITLTPSPASGQAGAYLPAHLPRAMLTLHAATGQPVLSQRLSAGQNVVPLSGLPAGLYFYGVRDGDRLVATGKLVVE